jgi:WD40-like Beta Propeller Repeat
VRASCSLDGRRIAFEAVASDQKQTDIYVFDFRTGATRPLVDWLSNERNPVWAGDGHVYFASDDPARSGVWRIAVDSQDPADRLTQGSEIPVAEDGGFLYFMNFAQPPLDFTTGVWRLSRSNAGREKLLDGAWSRYTVWKGKVVYVSPLRPMTGHGGTN